MKGIESKTLLGILLIIGGLFFLMQSLGLLMLDDLWPIIFAAAGAVFLYNFVRQRQNWWAVIPGMALLGIGTLIAFDQIFPRANDAWGGAIFLAAYPQPSWQSTCARQATSGGPLSPAVYWEH